MFLEVFVGSESAFIIFIARGFKLIPVTAGFVADQCFPEFNRCEFKRLLKDPLKVVLALVVLRVLSVHACFFFKTQWLQHRRGVRLLFLAAPSSYYELSWRVAWRRSPPRMARQRGLGRASCEAKVGDICRKTSRRAARGRVDDKVQAIMAIRRRARAARAGLLAPREG
jgi:hypothetical protein